MTHRALLVLGLIFTVSTTLRAQGRPVEHLSATARADSAAVLAARSTFQWVEAALKAGGLARRDTTVECENMPSEATITLYRDSAGVVRQLKWEGGSEDQHVTTTYYYDGSRRLRFAFREQAAVNGTLFEERVYYNDGGNVARRLRKLVRGPGWGSKPVEPAHDPVDWVRRFCEN